MNRDRAPEAIQRDLGRLPSLVDVCKLSPEQARIFEHIVRAGDNDVRGVHFWPAYRWDRTKNAYVLAVAFDHMNMWGGFVDVETMSADTVLGVLVDMHAHELAEYLTHQLREDSPLP
jgi:hypothetical protein